MGLDEAARAEHIAWDIGAAAVAERVAERLGAPSVLCNYSRLVIDCNRYPDAADAAPSVSDGIAVPGNTGLSTAALAQRAAVIAEPYHMTIAGHLDTMLAQGVRPIFLSIHSCTASMGGVYRPWPIGLAWNRDNRFSRPVLEHLKAAEVGPIGENEPYALDFGADFTTPEHALTRGLAYLQVEFRNDLIAIAEGALRHADILADAILAAAGSPEVMRSCREPGDYLRPSDPLRGDFARGR
jgi:predicted N-formylglutamate amidohydrolase